MKMRILDAASRDLAEGYHFYEIQQAGLGGYFLDSLYSDIDFLQLYAGIHVVLFGHYHRALSVRNLLQRQRTGSMDLCSTRLPPKPGVDQSTFDTNLNNYSERQA